MLCKDAEELIKNYKRGSITADNFLLLIQHTKECPHCKTLFEQAEASMETGQAPSLFSGIAENFRAFEDWIRKKQKERKFYTTKTFYGIITLVAIALLVFGTLRNFSFNQLYFFISSFMIFITLVIFIMLFTIEE
jgi:hypothetical protein